MNTTQLIFLNFNTVLSDLTPEDLAKIETERGMKSETVRIHFLSDVFRFDVMQKFCYHGNVTSHFSSLLRLT